MPFTVSTNPALTDRIQLVVGVGHIGPFVQNGPLESFDPRRDLQIYADGVLIPVRTFSFDFGSNLYTLFLAQQINVNSTIQVVHHVPDPPFIDAARPDVIQFAKTSFTITAGAGSQIVNLPFANAVTKGNAIVVSLDTVPDPPYTLAVTDNLGNSYALVNSISGSGRRMNTYVASNAQPGVTTVTATVGGRSVSGVGFFLIHEFTDVVFSGAVDVFAGQSGTSANPQTPNIITTTNDLIFGSVMTSNPATSVGIARDIQSLSAPLFTPGLGPQDFNASGNAVANPSTFLDHTVLGSATGLSQQNPYTLTAVANASGGNTAYTGSFSGGFSFVPPQPGFSVVVSGFSNPANNGVFVVVSSNSTTVVVNNPNGVAQVAGATMYGTVARLTGTPAQASELAVSFTVLSQGSVLQPQQTPGSTTFVLTAALSSGVYAFSSFSGYSPMPGLQYVDISGFVNAINNGNGVLITSFTGNSSGGTFTTGLGTTPETIAAIAKTAWVALVGTTIWGQIVPAAPTTVVQTYTDSLSFPLAIESSANALAFFRVSGLPGATFYGGQSGNNAASYTLGPFSFASNTNAVLVALELSDSGFSVFTQPCVYTVTDNQGNTYSPIISTFSGAGASAAQYLVLMATAPVTGVPTTLTFTQISGPAFSSVGNQTWVFSVSNLATNITTGSVTPTSDQLPQWALFVPAEQKGAVTPNTPWTLYDTLSAPTGAGAFVQAASAQIVSFSGSPWYSSLVSPTSAGNLLFAFAPWDTNSTATATITDTTGNVWTQLQHLTGSIGSGRPNASLYIWYAYSKGGDTTTFTLMQVVGSTKTYSYSGFTGPGIFNSAFNGVGPVGQNITISGFTNAANNGQFVIASWTGGASGTITVLNGSQVNETHAGTATAQLCVKVTTSAGSGSQGALSVSEWSGFGTVVDVNIETQSVTTSATTFSPTAVTNFPNENGIAWQFMYSSGGAATNGWTLKVGQNNNATGEYFKALPTPGSYNTQWVSSTSAVLGNWTGIVTFSNTATTANLYSQVVASPTSVFGSAKLSSAADWAALMLLFELVGTALPPINVQHKAGPFGTWSVPQNISLTSPVTQGNTLIAIFSSTGSKNLNASFTDNMGNVYTQYTAQGSIVELDIFVAQNAVAGATTGTLTISGNAVGAFLTMYELQAGETTINVVTTSWEQQFTAGTYRLGWTQAASSPYLANALGLKAAI